MRLSYFYFPIFDLYTAQSFNVHAQTIPVLLMSMLYYQRSREQHFISNKEKINTILRTALENSDFNEL